MRLWKVTKIDQRSDDLDKKNKTEVVKAWSMRHAQFLKTLTGPCTYLLIGRSNPSNPDALAYLEGLRGRDSSRDNPDGFKSRPRSAKADDGWKAR